VEAVTLAEVDEIIICCRLAGFSRNVAEAGIETVEVRTLMV
jgi:hypothetical protein